MMMDKVDPFVSDDGRLIFQYVCYSGICQGIVVFGILANIINIICFIQQGFREPVNVSLFGLAIADLGCLVSLLWLNICVTPAFQQADFSFDQIDIQYLTAAYQHIVFTRVTGWITAFITMERCLCIALPLQIKRIVTSRRVSIIISSTFVVLILSATPFYAVNVFSMKFHATRNRTVLGLIRTVDRTSVETVLYVINNVISPFVAFTTVIICTATLVVKLGRKSKWRQSAASSKSDALLNRDQKVAKMVLIISAVFIISFIPNCVVFIGMAAEPELAIDGMYRNTFIILFGIGFVLESINSAVNIFIYYHMSSKYRDVFQQIFRMLRIHGYISP